MPITVACSCGKKLAAKEEYAGRTLKCPGCGKGVKIPSAAGSTVGKGGAAKRPAAAKQPLSSAAQLLEEAGLAHHVEGPTCPECFAPIPEDAVLCVECGYNFKLKRRLHSGGKAPAKKAPAAARPGTKPEKEEKPKTEVDKTLAKAAKDLEKEPVEQDMGYGTKWAAWVLFLIMAAGMAAFIAGGITLVNFIEGQSADSTDDVGY